MYLSKLEERMLSGEFGEAVSRAMRVLVKFGDSVKAEKLIPITHAHISGISIFNIGDPGVSFIEDLTLRGAKFSVFTTANPYAAVNLDFNGLTFPQELRAKQGRINKALVSMGARAFTCAPYFIRRPELREHIAWAESSAVLYANSVCGALTNREGGPLALMEAIVGRAPYWGMHIPDNRAPEVLIKVPKPSSYLEAAVCGYLAGMLEPYRVPLISGLGLIPDDWVRAFLAGLGTSSQTPLAVIEGVSPEYREGLAAEVRDKVEVDRLEVMRFINENRCRVDDGETVYMFGCPHLSVKEMSEVIEKLMNTSKVIKHELWLVIGDYIRLGNELERKLLEKGVRILRNVCPVVTKLNMLGVGRVLTDSAKALHYMPKLAGVSTSLVSRFEVFKG